jgi:hypothetical protein
MASPNRTIRREEITELARQTWLRIWSDQMPKDWRVYLVRKTVIQRIHGRSVCGVMKGVPEEIKLRWVRLCAKADPEYGSELAKQLGIEPRKAMAAKWFLASAAASQPLATPPWRPLHSGG